MVINVTIRVLTLLFKWILQGSVGTQKDKTGIKLNTTDENDSQIQKTENDVNAAKTDEPKREAENGTDNKNDNENVY